MRRHSYRTLAKRQLASRVLFYLEDPEDAKTIFKHSKFSEKEKGEWERAYTIGEDLLTGRVNHNLSQFSPHVEEIKAALEKAKSTQLLLL